MARAWWLFLTMGLTLTVGYCALPAALQLVALLGAGTAGVVAQVAGIRRHRPEGPGPWWLLVAGTSALVLGDAVHASYDVHHLDVPFPSLADGVYLLACPLLLAALALAVRRSGRRDIAAWLDAGIWTGGAFVGLWLPLVAPYAENASLGVGQRWLALSFPLMDLVVLLLLVHLIARQREAGLAHRLLAIGMLGLFLGDVVYGMRSLTGLYHSGEPTDMGWLLAYVAMGSAALHPSMRELTAPRPRSDHPSQRRLVALTAPALTAPALLTVLLVRGDLQGDVRSVMVVAGATALLFVLSSLRGRGLILDLRNREAGLQNALRDRERLTEELRSRATCCALTGLVNRTGFMELVGASLAQPVPLAVGLLDLDDFKGVNDSLGHDAGDRLLVEVAGRLRSALGRNDVVGRLGGDEFALLLRGDVPATADRVIQVLDSPFLLEGQELRVQASLGVVERTDSSSLGDLMRRADVAMYAAKAAGGNRWTGYRPEMSASLLRRLDLRSQLVVALERQEIEPWYQPVTDLETGELLGFEALARWCRPGRPVQSPGEWIGLAEETGLVVPMDLSVLRQAIREMAVWRALTPTAAELDLAVNCSGRTLQSAGSAEAVLSLLEQEGVPPSCLLLEVTEGVLLDDEAVGRRLQLLRAAGVRIALDDFGTGWSSLSYLSRFPVDVLKLDRTFTAGLGRGLEGEAVPAAVVQLARALRLEVIAEGVETAEQVTRLRQLGARCAQGYLFGRPASAARTRQLVLAAAAGAATSWAEVRA
ncbi:MAG: EAL domain-containing protein [Mycobacteriales bacterium]